MFEHVQGMGFFEFSVWGMAVLGTIWLILRCLGQLLYVVFGRRGGADAGFGLLLFFFVVVPGAVFFSTVAYWGGYAAITEIYNAYLDTDVEQEFEEKKSSLDL